jgi:hypothetical protein
MANTELIEFLPDNCSPAPTPHTYGCIGTRDTATIPNTYGFDFPTDFGSTSAADTYFHAVDDGGTTYFFPPATGQPSTPTLATNVAGIQAFLTSIGSGITYTINAFNEIVLTYANPGDESIWSFWMGTSNSSDSWNNKTTPTLHDLQVDTQTYQQVQVVKFQQADGTYIDKFFIPSGDVLVEVPLKPENTFKFGNCPDCKKAIFATHDRYISVPGIPANAVAYEMTNNLPTQGLDVSNSYFHLIYPTLNGANGTPIGPQLTEYFSNPQDGILWNDVAGVQAVIDYVLPSMGLSVGDITYAINTSNLPIFFLSPTAVNELANSTYLHIYWGPNATHNTYNEKADVNVLAANSNVLLGGEVKCVGIQEIKEKDTCTGEETYRYVIEDKSGNLVPVTDIYPNFVEADVLLSCTAVKSTIAVPICAGTTEDKEVDSIVAAYILNQENKHTEKIYDVLTAVFGGTIAYTYNAPLEVVLSYSAVTLANDTLRYYWTDFGDGYNDVGGNPSHTYNADGSYEIKSYAVTASGNKVLLIAKEVNIFGGVISYAPTALPQPVSANYQLLVNSAFQDYCGSSLVGSPYNADGTPYTLVGDFVVERPIIIDLLEDNGDYQAAMASASITPTLVTPVYSTNRTLQTVNTTPAAYNVATIANSREITVQNLTNSDVQITTSQGAQIVATRGVITLSNPNNTTVNQSVFTGNITVTFLSSVGENIGEVAPRVIINQKAYV